MRDANCVSLHCIFSFIQKVLGWLPSQAPGHFSLHTASVKQPPPLLANDLYPGALPDTAEFLLNPSAVFRASPYSCGGPHSSGVPPIPCGSQTLWAWWLSLVACLITCSKNHATAAITRRQYHSEGIAVFGNLLIHRGFSASVTWLAVLFVQDHTLVSISSFVLLCPSLVAVMLCDILFFGEVWTNVYSP